MTTSADATTMHAEVDDDWLREAGFIVDRSTSEQWGSAYAIFDRTRRFRYALGRCWGPGAWRAYVMLNPSTADAFIVDPTVSRCLKRAKAQGFGGALVLNLFALRSTDPLGLLDVLDPVGPDNDTFLLGMPEHVWHEVIVGWGKGKSAAGERLVAARAREVCRLLDGTWELTALAVNADGSPKHPLYCRDDAVPQPWSAP